STYKAEYIALTKVVKEALYLYNSYNFNLTNLGFNTINKPKTFIDNLVAKELAENPKFYKKSKYINIKYHFTRESLLNKDIMLFHIDTKSNIVDILTKPLGKVIFNNILNIIYNNNNNNNTYNNNHIKEITY
ncbi:hypothetical protein GQ607_007182, partial [Colletotrichum asianum]